MAEKRLWKPAGRKRSKGTVGTQWGLWGLELWGLEHRPVGTAAGETPKSLYRPDSLPPTSPCDLTGRK